MPFDWAVGENAIRQWLRIGSGYGDQNVIHLNDNGSRHATDYIAFSLSDLVPVGSDAVITTFDGARPNGSQIEIKVQGERESTLTIQAFTTSRNANSSARAALARVLTAVGLPTVRAALSAAGLVIWRHGQVQFLPAVLNTGFEGRAIMTCTLRCTDDISELTTWIQTAEAIDENTGNVITITT